jgi:hypothetical protein
MSLASVSGDDVLDHTPGHVGEAEVAAVVAVRQLRVVKAHQVQDRCLEVVDGHLVLDRLVPELVGLAVVNAALRTAAAEDGV